jgi:L-ribulose-5-phosphate 4-epimerase
MMAERLEVFNALRLMAEQRDIIQDTHGNVSARAGQRMMFIKPSGIPYEKIMHNEVCMVEFDENGAVTFATPTDKVPSVDAPHHARIYNNHQRIGAICHVHSPHIVAYAIAGEPIVCSSTEQADSFGGDIRCVPYSDLNSWGDVEIGDRERALLLGNHGGLTFADTAVEAVKLATRLENVAMKDFLARIVRATRSTQPLGFGEIVKWHERYMNTYGQVKP